MPLRFGKYIMEPEQTGSITREENSNFSYNEHNEFDLLPEYCHYRNGGYEFASSCLNCPLVKCIYDENGGRQRFSERLRNREMLRLFKKEGKGVGELASMFGISQRTVQRALKESAEKEVYDSSCRGTGGNTPDLKSHPRLGDSRGS